MQKNVPIFFTIETIDVQIKVYLFERFSMIFRYDYEVDHLN